MAMIWLWETLKADTMHGDAQPQARESFNKREWRQWTIFSHILPPFLDTWVNLMTNLSCVSTEQTWTCLWCGENEFFWSTYACLSFLQVPLTLTLSKTLASLCQSIQVCLHWRKWSFKIGRDWQDSTADNALALITAIRGLIPGTLYGALKTTKSDSHAKSHEEAKSVPRRQHARQTLYWHATTLGPILSPYQISSMQIISPTLSRYHGHNFLRGTNAS